MSRTQSCRKQGKLQSCLLVVFLLLMEKSPTLPQCMHEMSELHIAHNVQTCSYPRTDRQYLPMTQPCGHYILLLTLPSLPDHTITCSGLDLSQIYTARPAQWIMCITYALPCWFSNSSGMPPDIHTISPTPVHVSRPKEANTKSLLIESKLSLRKKDDICI